MSVEALHFTKMNLHKHKYLHVFFT